jgi:hypothetical protein
VVRLRKLPKPFPHGRFSMQNRNYLCGFGQRSHWF